jgi:DNA-binding transcriptional LysR family regulator
MGKLEEMQAFVRTAEFQSFTAAARRLGLSKSMVSQRVADLELRLGVRLLNRTTRRLSLTEAGQGFLEGCARALREVEEAEEAASRHGSALRGTLRLAAPSSFALLHLRPALLDFMTAHPQLDIDLDMDDRIVDLIQGGFDMAVRIGRLPDSSLIARRLAPSRIIACASPAYLAERGRPEHPAQLSSHECLRYAGTTRGDHWSFRIDGQWVAIAVAGRLQANNGDILLSAAIAGHGIALLPSFIVGAALERGELCCLLSGFPAADGAIHAVYPPARLVPQRVRAFTDFLAERIGQNPYWDRMLPPPPAA